MKVVAIIQARMGSTRLPGKILKKVLDKPLLEYQIERVKRSKLIDEIVIATTTNEIEQPIVDFCNEFSILYYRGSEDDVLSRYFEAAKEYSADVVVRLTSDCPIIDPAVIDSVIGYYKNNNSDYDYVSNTLKRTYPRGYDTEVFSFRTLENAYINAREIFEREHVTPYIYQQTNLFRIDQVLNESDNSNCRFTVDTKEDFLLIEKILTSLYKVNNTFSHNDVMELLDKNKEWQKINANVSQKNV
ncbi:cytidylyltransferase domain-containing protein [Oceanobacillus sp. CF4.6]|uniref:cytidylyltransferase domain-containing protein n=1 Tax=Oceanobacillus sp. CF4.6 TaxID=3373080 RepID=UPI003EE77576